jgi:hypothetical protein
MNTFIVLIHLSLALFLAYFLWKKQHQPLRVFFWPALSLKIASGIFLGFLYFSYYRVGDTLLYFRDAKLLTDLAFTDFSLYVRFLIETVPEVAVHLSFTDTRAILFDKFASLAGIITLIDDYWLISGYFSLIGFLGSWYLFRKLHSYFPQYTAAAAISFLFFPSVVLWTSGLIKESLAASALFFLTGLFLTAWFEKRVRVLPAFAGLIALWMLWGLKYYYAALLVPVVVACLLYKYVFVHIVSPRRAFSQIILWMLIFLLPLAIVTLAHPNFYLNKVMDVIVSNHNAFRMFSNENDLIGFDNLEPRVGSILWNSPLALISGLFRPFIWEAGNALQLGASIENLLILALTALGLKNLTHIRSAEHRILVTGLLVYVVLLCVLLTLSTPNFGTLSRYRVGYMPFFLFVVLCGNPAVKFFERKISNLVRSQ